jgi:hypothetical protein
MPMLYRRKFSRKEEAGREPERLLDIRVHFSKVISQLQLMVTKVGRSFTVSGYAPEWLEGIRWEPTDPTSAFCHFEKVLVQLDDLVGQVLCFPMGDGQVRDFMEAGNFSIETVYYLMMLVTVRPVGEVITHVCGDSLDTTMGGPHEYAIPALEQAGVIEVTYEPMKPPVPEHPEWKNTVAIRVIPEAWKALNGLACRVSAGYLAEDDQ